MPDASELVFLKLGGSLITEKSRPRTPRLVVMARLAREIAAAHAQSSSLRLVLGHGAGSFAHVPAKKYRTREGIKNPRDWLGFVEVWHEAVALNHIVMQALQAASVPAIAFPPSAGIITREGEVQSWDLQPMLAALEAGLVPVVYGDVIFDSGWGATILSTEELFLYLAGRLQPQRVLLAGIEPGVWADYPACNQIIPEITPDTLADLVPVLAGSAATDVTGGMLAKVQESLKLVDSVKGLKVMIFSGRSNGALLEALNGTPAGTTIHAGQLTALKKD
jgi:isopentenyl phosphate kinase